MTQFLKEAQQIFLKFDESSMTKLIISILIILLLTIVRIIINHLLLSRITDIKTRYNWRKTVSYFTMFIGLLLIGRQWFAGMQSLATFFGLLSAGVAIALKDFLVNLAGWIFIISRTPFRVGDRIQIGDFAGDVIDQAPFMFTILEIGNWVHADQSTGRMINIPNGLVFQQPLSNYQKGFDYIWNEIPVLVTFESNWRKAKNILTDIIVRHSKDISKDVSKQIQLAAKKYMIFYKNLTPIVYTSVEDSGVLLTLRYLTKVRSRRGTSERIWEEILDEFAKCPDIDFAYPTTRFYNNIPEGKPGAKASPEEKYDLPPSPETDE